MNKFNTLVERIIGRELEGGKKGDDVPMAGEWGTILVSKYPNPTAGGNSLASMGDIEKLVKKLVKKENLKITVVYQNVNTQYIVGDIRDLNWFEMRLRQHIKKNSLPDVKVGKINAGVPKDKQIVSKIMKDLGSMNEESFSSSTHEIRKTNEGDYVIWNKKTKSIDLATDNPKDFPKLKMSKEIYTWDEDKDGAD